MATRIAVMMSRLVGYLVVALAIRSPTDCGSSIDCLITCAQPSVMMWLDWPGKLWHLTAYCAGDGKMLEPCRPSGGSRGEKAAVAATAETVVEDGREG